MEAPNRFGVVSDEELLRIISEGTNGNTARATSTWLRVVSEYREEKGVGLSFATCTAEELAAFLERFYAEVKPKKHGEYSKSSYLAARAAIQRHLRIVKRPFNIFSDEPFAQANKVLDCVLKRHKKMGLERQTKHKDPISGEDLAKVSAYFDDVLENPTPTKVTEYCWFVITCHFCLRAREVQASIRKDDLIFEAGGDGQMSVRLGADFMSKNCAGGLKGGEFSSPRQVAALRLLFDHLNPDVDRIFQRAHPSFKLSDQVWFMKSPLGHNLLGKMMARISEKSGCSMIYTNHCLRATSITILKKSGFSDIVVCSVSGHKNVASLKSYCRPHGEDCKTMAEAIDKALEGESSLAGKEEVKSPAPFLAGSTSVPCDKHQEVEEEKEAEEAKEKQQPASEGSAQFPGCVKICGNSNTTIHFNVDWSCVSAPPPKRPRKGQ